MIIPFLICGLFTSSVLNFINSRQNIYKYVLKIAGIILIIFGCYMIYNASKSINTAKSLQEISQSSDKEEESVESYLYNLELKDTEDNPVHLSDYAGKYIVLNFTGTWCQYCKMEMPELEEFAEENTADTVCMYIFSPMRESGGEELIKSFVKDNECKIKTLIDSEDIMFYYCGINSYPTTFVLSPEGKFLTYVNGALNKDNFNKLLEYAKTVDVEN
jgi:cytochrome c-type biogenesis protein